MGYIIGVPIEMSVVNFMGYMIGVPTKSTFRGVNQGVCLQMENLESLSE